MIHTSGTGLLCFGDLERKTFGQTATKVFDDWDGIGEVTSLLDYAPHRQADKIVLAAASDHPGIRTAIVCPPCIYGKGRGPGNQRSIQMPDLTKCILQEKKGFRVGEGTYIRSLRAPLFGFLSKICFKSLPLKGRASLIDAWLRYGTLISKFSIGLTFWANVHVHDLSDCFLMLVEAAVSEGGRATWNTEGYYFTENGEHVWGDMAKLITKEAHAKGRCF